MAKNLASVRGRHASKWTMKRGFFISVEGGEGVGKSTFIAAFVKALSSHEKLNLPKPIVQTREPGGTAIADSIRSLFANPPAGETLTPEAEAMLVMAARAQHVAHVIRPAIESGSLVVCDRFFDSTMVYQGTIGGLDCEWLEAANHFATKGLKPDMTILLDCPVEVSVARSESRARLGNGNDGASRYDAGTIDQHERIRTGFLDCARRESGRFVVLDADKPVETVVSQAIAALTSRLN